MGAQPSNELNEINLLFLLLLGAMLLLLWIVIWLRGKGK